MSENHEINYFTVEQAAAFLGALDHDYAAGFIQLQHVVFFQIAFFAGLRRGELIALTWADIDLDAKELCVLGPLCPSRDLSVEHIAQPGEHQAYDRPVQLPLKGKEHSAYGGCKSYVCKNNRYVVKAYHSASVLCLYIVFIISSQHATGKTAEIKIS